MANSSNPTRSFLVCKMGVVIIVPPYLFPQFALTSACLAGYKIQVPALWEVPLAALHCRAKGAVEYNQGHQWGREGRGDQSLLVLLGNLGECDEQFNFLTPADAPRLLSALRLVSSFPPHSVSAPGPSNKFQVCLSQLEPRFMACGQTILPIQRFYPTHGVVVEMKDVCM